MKKVIIVGAGIGGLATANLLAKAGCDVSIYEKASSPGGRAGKLEQDGFIFDTGPSWYLMPEVFKHYYELLGENVADELDLVKLDPAYKVFFEGDAPAVITGDTNKDSETFDNIEAGSGRLLNVTSRKVTPFINCHCATFCTVTFRRCAIFCDWMFCAMDLQ